MARSSDDYESDEYRPDGSDAESDDASQHTRMFRQPKTRSQRSEERPCAATKAIRLTRTRPSTNTSSRASNNRSAPKRIVRPAELPSTVPQKRKMPSEYTSDGYASATSDSDMPIVPRKPTGARTRTQKKQESSLMDFVYKIGEDPLYKARARCVELLADLHNIKDWMEYRNIYRDAPSYIRDTLDQKQI